MATWKKVLVSGSSADVSGLKVSNSASFAGGVTMSATFPASTDSSDKVLVLGAGGRLETREQSQIQGVTTAVFEITGSDNTKDTFDSTGDQLVFDSTGDISVNVAASSGKTTLKLDLPVNIVSGSAQILPGGVSNVVSSSAQINSLINDTIAATIVAEIDNDEIPIAKLSEDSITIAGTSTTLGGSITAATILGGTSVFSGSGQLPTGIVSGADQINSLINDTIAATIVAEIDNDEIPIAKLAQDSITIAGNATALGGSITAATILEGTGVISGSAQFTSDINAATASLSESIKGTAKEIEVTTDSNDDIIIGLPDDVEIDGDVQITGSLIVSKSITADTLTLLGLSLIDNNAAVISGSNIFGDSVSDFHQFTGSVSMVNGLTVSTITASLPASTTANVSRLVVMNSSGHLQLADDNINTQISGAFTPSAQLGGTGIVSSSAQINSLINDTIAATIVAEIDNDEIPIAKLAEDSITIAGNSTALGGSITAATILQGTEVVSGSAQINSLITDQIAATIVAEIDNDEIPIAKLAEDSVTVTAGLGLSGGGSVTLGGSTTLNADGLVSESAQILPGGVSGIVSSSAQINSLINDTIAATIVAEIDNDEIPIAKLAEDSITIAGNATALGGSITAATILGGTGVVSGSDQISSLVPDGTVSGSVEGDNQGQIKLNGNNIDVHDMGSGDSPTFANLTITGDLNVTGTTNTTVTNIQTENLNVEDQFILLNSGALTPAGQDADTSDLDAGFIFDFGGGSGSSFFYNADSKAFGVKGTNHASVAQTDFLGFNTVASNDTDNAKPDYIVSVVSQSTAQPIQSTAPTYGNSSTKTDHGTMHVNTSTGDIWIYS